MTAKYVIGIDLGTTNSVVAYAPLTRDQASVEVLPIPQLVAAGTTEPRSVLPSFLYLAPEHEAGQASFDLPWAEGRAFAVGEIARAQAAEMPDRTVSAAKSWLAHSRVDRHQAILPWNAPAEVAKVSPVMASRRYLEHMIAAWEAAFPDAPIAQQQVVLTVPASFDASARELTHEAALAAGLPAHLVLLEEPQAAVYAWLADRGERWRKAMKLNDTLLVVDVGGGTTDLTLVTVAQEEGDLVLRRMAVGNHLLVGGDNMDLALAHHVAGLFAEKGHQLDPWQSVALWHSCRTAKEKLLSPGAPKHHAIAVLGRGSKLIGKTVKVDVERDAIANLLVEGFFPPCAVSDKPAKRRASGFQEIGLPFESDTAVTRHLAAFLQAHADQGEQKASSGRKPTERSGHQPPQPANAGRSPDGRSPVGAAIRPTHVLFNGGVFKADVLQDRLLEVLGNWFGDDAAPRRLEGTHDLDHAVARGAAYYGWAKERGGVRIRGGTARSYYVGIESAGLAVPGAARPLRALCVVPHGMEEGTEVNVPSSEIGLVVGEPAHFRFFSSPTRKHDKPGDLLPSWTPEELSETDSLEATLPADDASEEGYAPVRFQSRITELGMFELWCVGTKSDQRWKLEFSVRDDAGQ